MDRAKIEIALINAFNELRNITPIDTGNLRYNALRYEWEAPNIFVIYISGNGKSGIAPYMPFTNEEWVSPRWHGKKNPNEGWFEKGVKLVAKTIRRELKAIEKEDLRNG